MNQQQLLRQFNVLSILLLTCLLAYSVETLAETNGGSRKQTTSVALFDLHLVDDDSSFKMSDQKTPKNKPKKKTKAKAKPMSQQEMLEFANQSLSRGLVEMSKRDPLFQYIDKSARQTLLDPIWNNAPSTIEEALELGRELGVDWAIQGHLKQIGPKTYRIQLYILALTPSLWQNQKKQNSRQASRLVDFNTLDTKELILGEHIVWASRLDRMEYQLLKAGRRLLLKAEQGQEKKRQVLIKPKAEEEEEDKKETKSPLSARERLAQELSDAARKELDDIQARLDAEHARRKEEKRLKKIVLAEEAQVAWEYIEKISGGAGFRTITFENPPSPSFYVPVSERKKEDLILKSAQATWKDINAATANQLELSLEEHRNILLTFIRTYENKLPSFRSQVEEARHRFTWINRRNIEWIPVRGGRFQVGSSFPVKDERPIQWITISPFEVSISEVTNAQYKTCVDAKVCTPPHWDDKTCEVFTDLKFRKDRLQADMRRGDMPVVCIDWKQANTYAKWVGGRLLSETEWEFIARSSEKSFVYPWGMEEATCSHAVMHTGAESGCGFGIAWPVCSKTRGSNNIGICDLAGNVWEWVSDQYRPNHEKVPANGKPFLGPGKKVIKGGCFSSNYKELYASTRGQFPPTGRSNSVGFRIARSEQEAR